jgi:TATA-binding protein-associated factor Taf7
MDGGTPEILVDVPFVLSSHRSMVRRDLKGVGDLSKLLKIPVFTMCG